MIKPTTEKEWNDMQLTGLANACKIWNEEYKRGEHTKSAEQILQEKLNLTEKLAQELVNILITKFAKTK